jgi:hypothetical protein
LFSQAEGQPSRGRLVVDCKEAPESEADLRDPSCLAAVLGHMEREFGIESVVLSHYVERQYGADAMDALRRIVAIANLLTQLGSRPPAPNFPGLSRKQITAKCEACRFNPKTLFDGLRSRLERGFTEFHASFAGTTEQLQRYREPGCAACVSATTNDLVYLFRSTTAFGDAALKASPPEEVSR